MIGRTKGGMNTKLHTATDAEGRPIRFFLSAIALAATVMFWL